MTDSSSQSDRIESRTVSEFTVPSTSTQGASSTSFSPFSSSSKKTTDWSTTLRTLITPIPPSSILADLAPQLLQSRILGSTHSSSRNASNSIAASSSSLRTKLGLHWGASKPTQDSNSIYIREKVEDLLRLDVPAAPFDFASASGSTSTGSHSHSSTHPRIAYIAPDSEVPLIRGFLATAPAAQTARLERRRRRAGLGEMTLGLSDTKLGLKERGEQARGLLRNGTSPEVDVMVPVFDPSINRRPRKRKSGRRSEILDLHGRGKHQQELGALSEEVGPVLSPEELEMDSRAVENDMANVAVRRALLNVQINEIDVKVSSLEEIREALRKATLGLREEELELEDELEGLREQMSAAGEGGHARVASTTSRRRKGPAFLPSEHDDLPSAVAFMSLTGHVGSISALDFSEPYGIAVTASTDESVRLWDLTTGAETGYLRGHRGAVKVLQVESSMCVTGGTDGQIRIWDLDAAEAQFMNSRPATSTQYGESATSLESVLLGRSEQDDDVFGFGKPGITGLGNGESLLPETPYATPETTEEAGSCVKTLEGHSKAVSTLYFDGSCLVTGSSDSTLRQWDLQTGQCVLTMDILWAISNSSSLDAFESNDGYTTPASSPRKSLGALRRQSSGLLSMRSSPNFASMPTTTTYADGSFELYEDFVGGVQFWGYALASGTADGCVRMWDMRTGQAHRTLVGHTGPVTCVQFDELHLISGSLDKSIRIWDLRTGSISDTIRYEHPVTSLQFDSRKIVAAAGENGVRVFNRTTLQHDTLTLNGHTRPAERVRFMDSYLMSGGRDEVVKIWRI